MVICGVVDEEGKVIVVSRLGEAVEKLFVDIVSYQSTFWAQCEWLTSVSERIGPSRAS